MAPSLVPRVQFSNIGNVHTMRASWEKLQELVLPWPQDDQCTEWLRALDDTGWLYHVRLVLTASINVAQHLTAGCSVLVHCSDGWDRTSQVCSLAQLILDPYFRTMRGFAVLIEKDWCSFGHKFEDRCGHGTPCHDSGERSPIFVQWLDSVHQLLLQFPRAFEFNHTFLVFLADHVHSCLFGTFLGNSEHDRTRLGVTERTTSIWAYVLHERCMSRFLNPNFSPENHQLRPSASAKRIELWRRFFCRWDSLMHPAQGSGDPWIDDWGSDVEDGGYGGSAPTRHRLAANGQPTSPSSRSDRAHSQSAATTKPSQDTARAQARNRARPLSVAVTGSLTPRVESDDSPVGDSDAGAVRTGRHA